MTLPGDLVFGLKRAHRGAVYRVAKMNGHPTGSVDSKTMGALVYLVDDDIGTRMTAERTLRQAGLEVVGFGAAEAALVAVTSQAPEAVVLDIILPGQHGLDALRGILTTRPETSVVIASGIADPEIVAEAMRCGAANFLVKPVADADLVSAVRHAVDWTRLKRRINEIENRLENHGPPPLKASGPRPPLAEVRSFSPAPERRATTILDLQTLERRAIEKALRRTAGNVSEAARRLGIGRTTLYRKMVSYGLEKAA